MGRAPSGARGLRERLWAARPMLAGRPHEAAGNGSPRWMAVGPRFTRVHRTRPTGRLAPHPWPWPALWQDHGAAGALWGHIRARRNALSSASRARPLASGTRWPYRSTVVVIDL